MEKQIREEWRPVRGFENYEVSNYGEVKSLNYKRTGKEKILKFSKDKEGYLLVHLYKNGVRKSFRINRLVYMTFVGEIPEDIQVNHIDEDKENNCVWNLNLMTSKENNNWGTHNEKIADALRGRKRPDIADALRGRKLSEERKRKISATETNHPQKSKAVQALDKNGNVVYEFPSTQEAGRQGFKQSSVSKCCNGKRKTAYGFIWRYAEK